LADIGTVERGASLDIIRKRTACMIG
jgi:hypothetical protein